MASKEKKATKAQDTKRSSSQESRSSRIGASEMWAFLQSYRSQGPSEPLTLETLERREFVSTKEDPNLAAWLKQFE